MFNADERYSVSRHITLPHFTSRLWYA